MSEGRMGYLRPFGLAKFTSILLFITSIFAFGVVGSAAPANAVADAVFTSIRVSPSTTSCSSTGSQTINYASGVTTYNVSLAAASPSLRIYMTTQPSGYLVQYKTYLSGGVVPGTWSSINGTLGQSSTCNAKMTGTIATNATQVYLIQISATGQNTVIYTINATNTAALTATTTTLTVKNGATAVTTASALTAITLTATLRNSGNSSTYSGTGTYNFTYGGTTISGCGTKSLGSGSATCTWNTPVSGSGSLQAIYSADATYAASTSSSTSFTVTSNATTSSITAKNASNTSVTSIAVGAPVTLTATASSASATGTYNFKFNNSSIPSCNAQPMTSGVATCIWTPTGIATAAPITALYSGDSAFTTSTATLASNFTVTQASTSSTLTAKNGSGSNIITIAYGQTVTLAANVTSSSATGTFNFTYNGSSISGCTAQAITSGSATCSWTTTAVSSAQNLLAIYSGDTNYSTSTTSPISFTVTQATSTISIAAATSSPQTNQSDLLTATITPSTASGTVAFKYGGTTITGCSIQPVSAGVATCSWIPTSTSGSAALTAVYSGDANYSTSTSTNSLSVAVTASGASVTTTSVLAISSATGSSTAPVNATITLTATLKNAAGSSTIAGTGTFAFNIGGTAIVGCEAKTLTTGVATCSWTPSAIPSSTSITVVYRGDSTNITSTSTPSTFTVTKAATTSAITATIADSGVTSTSIGTQVTLTATVTSTSATGSFNFKLAGTSISGCTSQPITTGVATCLWTPATSFTNSNLTADYSGDTNYSTSTTSSPVIFTANKVATTTSLTAKVAGISVTKTTVRNTITLTATISSPSPNTATGTISFQYAGVPITSCEAQTLVSGSATCDRTPTGTFSNQDLTAVYSGDTKYAASTSAATTFTVALNATAGTLTAVDPSGYDAIGTNITSGTVVTLQYGLSTTTLAGSISTGTVAFTANGVAISGCSAVAVSASNASCSWTTTTAGDTTILATYSGDATYATTSSAATSATDIVTVDPGAISYSQSLISVSSGALTANGSSTSVITVTVKDSAGNTVTSSTSDTIALSASGALGSIGSVSSVGSGVYSATFTTGSTGGTTTISGTINGTAITSAAPTIVLTANTSSLSALAVTGGTLSPTFASATLPYTVSIPYATTTFKFTPTVTESHATIQYKLGSGSFSSITSATASPDIAINPGASIVVTIKVTAQDGVTTSSYTVTATRGSETNSDLSALTISPATISFLSSTTSYSASVANAVTSINVVPTLSGSYSTMTVNGTTKSSASTTAVPLSTGDNTITIVVTPQSGATKTYTITISRATTDATLSNLSFSAGSISFLAATSTYSVTVPYTTTTTTVTPTRNESHQTITVAMVSVSSGSPSGSINLAVGLNAILVVVTPQEGSTKTYTLNITRTAAETTNTLSALTISAGTLTPTFLAATTSYSASVASTVSTITVTPTAAGSLATLTVNGGAATSGSGSGVSLNYGSNTITIVVTSQSLSTKTYTITVTRALTSRTISMTSTASVTYGSTISLTASPSAGASDGTISFSAGSSTGCSVSGSTLSVTNASGTCSVSATITDGTTYATAVSSAQTITLSKASQTITLSAGSALAYRATRTLAATAPGTGTISYSADDPIKCALSGVNNSTITAGSGTGSCVITSSILADNNYTAASSTTTINVTTADQSLFALGSASMTNGSTLDLATYISGVVGTGTVSYSLGSGSCTLSGSVITANAGSGSCAVTASITADMNYNLASSISSVSLTASPPARPTGLAVTTVGTTAGGQIIFSWTAPVNTGNPDITGYEYQYKLSSGDSYSSGVKSTSSTSVTITGLSLNKSYDFQVRARNSMGAGTFANKVSGNSSGNVVSAPSGAPSITSVSTGDGQLNVKFTYSWDGNHDDARVTGYQYSTDGTSWRSVTDSDGGDGGDGGSRSVTITGLTNGTTYSIYIRALNVTGASSSSSSASGTPFGKPAAPTGVSLAKSTGKITVTFTPSDANGSTISGYQYSKKRGSDDYGDWQDISSLSVGVSTDSFDLTTSNDDKNKTIYIRVRAKSGNSIGGDGDNRGYSDASSAASTSYVLAAAATISSPTASTVTKNITQATFTVGLTATPATTETLSYQWYINAIDSSSGGSSTLPSGVTGATTNTLTFSSTLATAMSGYYYLIVTSTLSGSSVTTTSSRIRVIVNAGLAVSGSTVTLPSATVGKSYTFSFTTTAPAVFSGGSTPYTWAVTSKTNTSGLSDPTSGTVSGTATLAGTETWNIRVTDAAGDMKTTIATLVVNNAPQILTKSLPSGTKNLNYSTLNQSLAGSNGTAPLVWTKTSGPSWVSIDGSTGAISGTPSSSGSNSLVVRYTDANGAYDEATIILGVADVVPVQVTGLTKVSESNRSVDISWNASSDESSLSSYVVTYVSPKTGDKDEDRGSITTSSNSIHSLHITGLNNGRTYTITVAGKNAGSTGASSSSITGSPYALPSAPKSVSLVRSNGKLSVHFQKGEDDGGYSASSYSIQCSIDGSTWDNAAGDYVSNGDGDGNSGDNRNYDLKDDGSNTWLNAGVTISCRVAGVTSKGTGTYTTSSSTVYQTVPSVPNNLSVDSSTVSAGTITVYFKISSNDGGSAITSYVATLDKVSGRDGDSKRSCNYVLAPAATWNPSTTYSCVIRSVPTKYSSSTSIKVVAVNAIGNSASASVSITLSGKPQVLKTDDESGDSSFDGHDSHNLVFNKTYGDADFAIKLKLDSGLKINYQVATGSANCSLTESQMVHIKAVGQCTITIVQNGHSNEGDGEHDTDYSEFDSSSTTITVNIAPRKPGSPSFASVASDNHQLTATITPPAGAVQPTNYIFRYSTSNTGGWSSYDTRTVTSPSAYTLTGLTNGTPYYIEVRSNNSVGSSDPVITLTTYIPYTVPDKPVITSVTIDTSTASATVAWTALLHPSQSGGSPVTTYRATATLSGTPYSCSTSGSGTSCVITNLPYKQSLSFVLTAINLKGSTNSDPQSATVAGWDQTINRGTNPGAYGHTVGDGDIQLTATASSALPVQYSTTTSAVCSVSQDGSIHLITSGVCTVSMAQDGTNSKTAGGAVTKYNAAPSVTAWTMNIDPNFPSAPVITSVVNTTSGLAVNWTAPSRLGGGTLTYTVHFTPYINSDGNESTTATSFTLTGADIQKGVNEVITVTASNSVGSSTSASKTGIWQTVPGVPTTHTAVGSSSNGRQIDVAWADPVDNGGSEISGFTATATPIGDSLAVDPSLRPQTCSTTGHSCSIVNLRAGATYTVVTYATNGIGNGAEAKAAGIQPGKSQTVTISGGNVTKNFGSPAFSITATSTSGLTPVFTLTGANCTNASITSTGLFSYTGTVTNCAVLASVGAATTSNEVEYIAASATINVTISPVAPGPAVITSVVEGDASLIISWSNPTFTGDGGSLTTVVKVAGVTRSCPTSPCTVTGLPNGSPLAITIDETNSSALSATTATASGTPYLIVEAPTPLSLSPGHGSITARWAIPVAAATHPLNNYIFQYRVQGAGSFTTLPAITDTSTVSTTISGLGDGVIYEAQISGTYGDGTTSRWTSIATTKTFWLPDAPQNETLTVVNGGLGSITVSWQAPASTGGTTLTHYCVSNGGACESLDPTTLSKTYTGLTQNHTYTFTVIAQNIVGNSTVASRDYTTIATPDAPVLTLTSSTPASASAVLNWTTPADGGSAITSYTVTATPAVGSPSTCTVTAPTTTCTMSGLLYKQAYTFVVVATNSAGTSPQSNSVAMSQLTLAQTITLTSPGTRSFAAGTYVLNGVASSALPITYTSNSGSICTVPAPSTLTNSLVTFVGIGTCSITANQLGSGSNYSAADPVTITFAIAAYAPDGIPLLQLSPGASALTATWDPATQLGGSTLKYYILSFSHNLDWSDESIIHTTNTTIVITGLAPNTSYQVRVGVQTNDFTDPSTYVNVLNATTFSVPSAPGVPTWDPVTNVDGNTGSVRVTWTKSTSDGGTPITGYTARAFYASDRSDSGQSCTTITEVSGSYSCQITGLKGSRAYKFGATATNAVGSTPSALSTNTAQPGKSQTITVADGSIHHTAKSYSIGAVASSGLPITYTLIAETRNVNGATDASRHVCVLDPATGIVTVDVAGTCSIGVSQDGTTDGTTPSDYFSVTHAPITITVIGDISSVSPSINVTATHATLNFVWVSPADDGGLQLGAGVSGGFSYHIVWYDNLTPGTTHDIYVLPTESLSKTMTGLSDGNTYTVIVTALNFAGESGQ